MLTGYWDLNLVWCFYFKITSETSHCGAEGNLTYVNESLTELACAQPATYF